MLRRPDREDIAVLGHDVPVAAQHDRPLFREQLARMVAQPLHPPELVVELLRADGIAVGQIDRGDDDSPLDLGLDVAAVRVVGIAGKADAPQFGRVALRQDRDAVEALLAVPDRAVAGRLDVGDRQRFVGAFQLLQADDVGLLALEPFEQARQARADAVEL